VAIFIAEEFQTNCKINGVTSTLFDNLTNNLALNPVSNGAPSSTNPYVLDIWIDVPKVITEYSYYLPSGNLPYGTDWEFQVYNPDNETWETLDTVVGFSGTYQNTIPSLQTNGYYNKTVSTSILSRSYRFVFTDSSGNYIQFGEVSMSFTSTNLQLDNSVNILRNTQINGRLDVNNVNISNSLNVSNLTIDGNTLSSVNNENIIIDPNGTGKTSFNGFVGIGTDDPQERLHIFSQAPELRIETSTIDGEGDAHLNIISRDEGESSLVLNNIDTAGSGHNNWRIYTTNNDGLLRFNHSTNQNGTPYSHSDNQLKIDANGNVDINGYNPILNLNSGNNLLSTLSFGEGPTSRGQIQFDGSPAILNIGTISESTFYKTINIKRGDNKVGINIGESSYPSEALDVNGNIKASGDLNITGNTNIGGTLNVTGDVTGDVNGNAATATVLQNARTIGGVSFNGSADINLPGVNTTGNQDTTGSAASLTASYISGLTEGSLIDISHTPAANSNATIAVDLSEATDTTIVDGDYIVMLDGGSGGTNAKTSISNISNLFAGTGLTSTNSVLNIDSSQTNITSVGTLTSLSVDNLNMDGNTISSTNTNGDITIDTDGTGKIYGDNIIVNNIKNNLMDTNIWSTQSSGQISSNFGGYSLNQNAIGENNMLVNEIGPFGDYEYVWKSLASGNSGNADGGWYYDIDNVDYKFGYLSVVYFKVVNDASGRFYHGCLPNGVFRTDGTTGSTHPRTDIPYFNRDGIAISNFVENEWYVSIGIILPYKSGRWLLTYTHNNRWYI
jgi:hypothetical protein